MSKELQERADKVMKELKEMLIPLSNEINSMKYKEDDNSSEK